MTTAEVTYKIVDHPETNDYAAELPPGYRWDSGQHELVVVYFDPDDPDKPRREQRREAREYLRELIAANLPIVKCPPDCECGE